MIIALIATIGAVIVSANEEANEDEKEYEPYFNRRPMCRHRPFMDDLTEEQQEEIQEIITSMKEADATQEEIRSAIHEYLDENGILDERLDNAIDKTEKRLEILNRKQELRNEGYSWEEIRDIIQEEFDIEFPEDGQGMKLRPGFHRGSYDDLDLFKPNEGSEL